MKKGMSRLTAEQIDTLRPRMSQFKMVFLALVAGVIVFGIVVVAISQPLEIVLPPGTLSLILIGLGFLTGLQGLVIPALMRSATAKNITGEVDERAQRLAGLWLSSSLVGVALLESAVFLNLVGLFLKHNLVHLVVAGLFTVLMFVHYPGTNRVLDWIDRSVESR